MRVTRLMGSFVADVAQNVRFDGDRCLHRNDRFHTCAACVACCPTGAFVRDSASHDGTLQVGAPALGAPTLGAPDNGAPQFDISACEHCLACLPACPAGAITAEDEAQALLRCVHALAPTRLSLLCSRTVEADLNPSRVDSAIRVRGCLAGLGPGVLLLLVAGGLEEVVLRNDACADCEWQSLPDQLIGQVAAVQALLRIWGRDDAVTLSGPRESTWRKRRILSANSPPVSRRSFFRFGAPEHEMEAGPPVPDGKQPFRERLRIMQALQGLPAPAPQPSDPDLPIAGAKPKDRAPNPWAGLGFAVVAVTEACNACGACARVCPTGALSLAVDERSYRLSFAAQACIACDVCTHVCPCGALSMEPDVDWQMLFAGSPEQTLRQGSVTRCQRCRVPFPAAGGELHCEVCRFRIRNPFSSARPPRRAPSQTNTRPQATLRQMLS